MTEYPDKLERLSEVLRDVPLGASSENTDEVHVLAHALVDIEGSSRQIIALVDRLLDENEGDKDNVLHELREELRHVQYHVQDSRYLNVINPP